MAEPGGAMGGEAVGAEVARGRRRSGALLKEQAYAALKERILTGAFPSGELLSERQLVAELGGMSKTPIRAALERLEADGLVRISPQQGILVREISIREIVEIFDLRLIHDTLGDKRSKTIMEVFPHA